MRATKPKGLAGASDVIQASTARYGAHAADHWPAAERRRYRQWLLQHPRFPEERREEIEALMTLEQQVEQLDTASETAWNNLEQAKTALLAAVATGYRPAILATLEWFHRCLCDCKSTSEHALSLIAKLE